MLSHITFSYPPGATGDAVQKWFFIRGSTLLEHLNTICEEAIIQDKDLSEKLANTTLKTPLAVSPKGDTPWLKLIGALQLNSKEGNYFTIGERTISMGEGQATFYVLDRTGIIDFDISEKIEDEDKFKEEHKYSYLYIDGKKIKGPSYRNYASYLRDKLGSNLDDNVAFSKNLSELLLGKSTDYSKCDPVKDQRAVLPVLLATMFLAEPARNPRSYGINMMLLNLIEGKVTYGGSKDGTPKNFTWDMVLWHPDKLDGAPSKLQRRSVNLKDTGGVFKTITAEMPKLKDLKLSGGKLPAAMMNSANPKVRTEIDPDTYYTQEKELSVLIRWLCACIPQFIAVKGDDDSNQNESHIPDGEEIPSIVFKESKTDLNLTQQPWANPDKRSMSLLP